jgi:hypothetical protein
MDLLDRTTGDRSRLQPDGVRSALTPIRTREAEVASLTGRSWLGRRSIWRLCRRQISVPPVANRRAVGPMILKRRLADLDQRAVMGTALVVAGAAGAGAALDPLAAMPSASALVAVVVLGLLWTAAWLVVYGRLVAEAGPGRALVITYVNPVVAVALGVVFLGERPLPGPSSASASYWWARGRQPRRLAARRRHRRRRPTARPCRCRLSHEARGVATAFRRQCGLAAGPHCLGTVSPDRIASP